MAMNKKEQTRVNELETKLALRFTEKTLPDIPVPISYRELVKGYSYSSYEGTVNKSCSSGSHHNTHRNTTTSSKGGIAQYSSKLLALKAMRNTAEMVYATRLRRIDLLIEHERELT